MALGGLPPSIQTVSDGRSRSGSPLVDSAHFRRLARPSTTYRYFPQQAPAASPPDPLFCVLLLAFSRPLLLMWLLEDLSRLPPLGAVRHHLPLELAIPRPFFWSWTFCPPARKKSTLPSIPFLFTVPTLSNPHNARHLAAEFFFFNARLAFFPSTTCLPMRLSSLPL